MRRHAGSLAFVVLAGAMAFGQSTQSTDISKDKKDIRHDRRDLRGDRRDRNQDVRDVRHDQKDINHDRLDLNKDRADIARDKRLETEPILRRIELTRAMTSGISVTIVPTGMPT